MDGGGAATAGVRGVGFLMWVAVVGKERTVRGGMQIDVIR